MLAANGERQSVGCPVGIEDRLAERLRENDEHVREGKGGGKVRG